jgi:mRNA-degrading endonuclease toxin of MazEF toxin-antitoxin module
VVKGSLVWVCLDPARGAEVPKTRPCIIVSRTEANDVSATVTVVPLSSVRGRPADRLVQPLLSAKDTRLPKIHERFAIK